MNHQSSLVRTKARALQPRSVPVLAQEKQILTLGRMQHWDFRVLGVAPVPTTAIYHNDWWLVPLHEDTSVIPARALERVQALYAAGIRPKAFVIAHEAPKQIAPPRETLIVSPFAYWSKRVGEGIIQTAKVAGTVVSVVAPVVLAVLGAGLFASFALAGALVADPCLIAITDDDVWIQIDYWMA